MSTKTHYERTLEVAVSIASYCYRYRLKEQWETASKWFELATGYYPGDVALRWEQDTFSDKYGRWRRGE